MIARRQLAVVVLVAGCGGDGLPAIDSGVVATCDPPPVDAGAGSDPYAGRFDSPDQFAREGCVPGSLAGFEDDGIYPAIGLRTRTAFDGVLRTWLVDFVYERPVEPVLTRDDLLVRRTWWDGQSWRLFAIDVCAVTGGVLHGSYASCRGEQCSGPYVVDAPPLRRIAGEAEAQGLRLLGAWNVDADGYATNVRVADDVAYLSRGWDGLRIVSVADPAAPVELAHYDPGCDYYNDVKLLDLPDGRRFALVAGTDVRIVEVTHPADPRHTATLPVAPHTIFVEGTRVYLADGYSPTLYIWDLADPAAPVELAAWSSPFISLYGFHDLHVVDGIAYVSATWSGLAVIDARDPELPELIGFEELPPDQYWHSPWKTEVDGRALVVHGDEFPGPGSGIRIQDADPDSPEFMETLGWWHLRDEMSAHNVMAFGDRVYLAHYRDGIRVLDISDPAAPRQIGYFNTWIEGTGAPSNYAAAYGLDVDLRRQRIYVADSLRGLLILEGDDTTFH